MLNLRFRFVMSAVSDLLATRLKLIEEIKPFVIAIKNDKFWLVHKELCLCIGVALHRTVIVKMILRKVCHDSYFYGYGVKFVLVERMTSDLEYDKVDMSLSRVSEETLHSVCCTDCRIEIIELALASYFDNRSTKHSGFFASLFEDLIEIVYGCRLAICTRNSNHP